MSMMKPRIAILGIFVADLAFRAKRLPVMGETILGQGFASLAHLFSPERIIMGGGVAQTFDLMRDHLLATFQSEAMPAFRAVEIVPAALGDNAGLIGAASLALG